MAASDGASCACDVVVTAAAQIMTAMVKERNMSLFIKRRPSEYERGYGPQAY